MTSLAKGIIIIFDIIPFLNYLHVYRYLFLPSSVMLVRVIIASRLSVCHTWFWRLQTITCWWKCMYVKKRKYYSYSLKLFCNSYLRIVVQREHIWCFNNYWWQYWWILFNSIASQEENLLYFIFESKANLVLLYSCTPTYIFHNVLPSRCHIRRTYVYQV